MKTLSGKTNGYTLIECLIVLMTVSFFMLQSYQVIVMIRRFPMHHMEMQDLNGLHQLSLILALASDIEVSIDEISYAYKEERYTVNLVNNRLIIQPGTNIIMLDIDQIEFFEEEEKIKMIYSRNDKTKERVIYD
ncbi:hypothetical protein SDC9_161062 [bioreactor metagenome]|uniref:Prepilin-type N-terminal cleavage/methylation domain-containing protein n=1 Tax=bioreactor metagenome TaxID=1076179 RepID=A0A645FH65_9ZZZZ|nr:hypothetical protein [Erysipelotrichaceae bacterium]